MQSKSRTPSTRNAEQIPGQLAGDLEWFYENYPPDLLVRLVDAVEELVFIEQIRKNNLPPSYQKDSVKPGTLQPDTRAA